MKPAAHFLLNAITSPMVWCGVALVLLILMLDGATTITMPIIAGSIATILAIIRHTVVDRRKTPRQK